MDDIHLTMEQVGAIDHLYEHDHTLLIAPTGAGKTVICLTTVHELIEGSELRRVIVAAPARVVEQMVWPNEAAKWEHLRGLTVLQLEGTSQQRIKQLLSCPSDIIVVSLNNLAWLLEQDHGADGIIIDEISKASGKWTQGLKSKKRAGCFKWRVGMTATPVSQDFTKVWAMARILDGGAALGTNKSQFMERYFYSDYMGHNWTLREGADAQIMSAVSGLVHALEDDKASQLPKLRERERRFKMPTETREAYDEMRKDMVIEALDADAANEAVKSGKLRQLASGFIYKQVIETGPSGKPITKTVLDHTFDSARAAEAVEWRRTLGRRKGIIFYEFTEQCEMLRARLINITESVEAFKQGPRDILLAQINSLSHGVDGLQDVCSDVLFFHPMWSRDAYTQARDRIWRTGQRREVTSTVLVCENTLDDLVLERVEDRGVWMEKFMQHLRGE